MNESKKTGIFWIVALAMLGVATVVAWPTPTVEGTQVAGNDLFESFDDPVAAASMKIVTFDEEQQRLSTFEVLRDRESGLWTIPSRDGYPADAMAQQLFSLVLLICSHVAVALLMVSLLDFGMKYWGFEKRIRMTDQQLRDETRMQNGDPQTSARRRELQRGMR